MSIRTRQSSNCSFDDLKILLNEYKENQPNFFSYPLEFCSFRQELIERIVQISCSLQISFEIISSTVTLFDVYVTKAKDQIYSTDEMKLAIIACLIISLKKENSSTFSIAMISNCIFTETSYCYSVKEINYKVMEILKVLHYKTMYSSHSDFMKIIEQNYFSTLPEEQWHRFRDIAYYYLIQFLKSEECVLYSALDAVHFISNEALKIIKLEIHHQTVEDDSTVTNEQSNVQLSF